MVTAPGPDGVCVAPEQEAAFAVDLARIKLLVEAHQAHAIGVMPHQKCAGHPVSNEQHAQDALATVARLRKSLSNFSGEIVPLVWRYVADDQWEVEVLSEPLAQVA